MADNKFELGNRLRDTVTGIEGIATARVEYLNGCVQYDIRPKAKEGENTIPAGLCIDEQQLELVDEGVTKTMDPPKATGGAMTAPRQMSGR